MHSARNAAHNARIKRLLEVDFDIRNVISGNGSVNNRFKNILKRFLHEFADKVSSSMRRRRYKARKQRVLERDPLRRCRQRLLNRPAADLPLAHDRTFHRAADRGKRLFKACLRKPHKHARRGGSPRVISAVYHLGIFVSRRICAQHDRTYRRTDVPADKSACCH